MSICTVTIQDLNRLRAFVNIRLKKLVAENKPLQTEQFIREVYASMLKGGTEPSRALVIAQLIPGAMEFMIDARNKEGKALRDHFYEKGFDRTALFNLSKSWQNLSTVGKFFTYEADIISNVQQLMGTIARKSTSPGFESGPAKEAPEKKPWKAKVRSAKTTTGSEERNQTREDYVRRYKFLRHLLNLVLGPEGMNDSRNLNSIIKGGVRLTQIHHSRLNIPYINQGTVLVITDKDGNILKFDKDNKVTSAEDGMPMFYAKRLIIKEGNSYKAISYSDLENESSLISYKDLAKQLGITEEEAYEQQQKELAEEHLIQQYILEHPDAQVSNIITGGSLGYVKFDKGAVTSLDTVKNFDDSKIDLITVTDNSGPVPDGYTYFRLPNVEGVIQLERKVMSKELVDKIVPMLIDPIQINDRPITAVERLSKIVPYILTGKDRRFIVEEIGDYELKIQIDGKLVDLSNLEAARKLLTDFFMGGTKEFRSGQRISINSSLLNGKFPFNDYTLEKSGSGYTLVSHPDSNYNEWVRRNTYVEFNLDDSGRIQPWEAYLKYTTPPEEIARISPKKEAKDTSDMFPITEITDNGSDELLDEPSEAMKAIIKRLADDSKETLGKPRYPSKSVLTAKQLSKLKAQELKGKEWFESENNPLNKYISYKALFHIMNSDKVAEFIGSGINLYHGSDYTDLYHESWHTFSQLFLTKEEKIKLYESMKKLPGSFKEYGTNKKISFSSATYREIEEYLAEDFREYMLSDGKKIMGNNPVRNTIFRRILNFLKSLFSGTSYAQLIMNNATLEKVNTLYRNLRVGTINTSNFSMKNMMFGILNKGITATDKKSKIQALGAADSTLILDSVNSSFSELIHNIRKAGGSKTFGYLSTREGRIEAYKAAKQDFSDMIDKFLDKYEKEADPIAKSKLVSKIQTLSWALDNFGDPEKLNANKDGVIAYHMEKSEFKAPGEEEEEDIPVSFDNRGNKKSAWDGASKETKSLIGSLHDVGDDEKVIRNELGFKKLVNVRPVWNSLVKLLRGSDSPEEMRDRLEEAKKKLRPGMAKIYDQLLGVLGDPNTQSPVAYWLWDSVWHDLNLFKNEQKIQVLDEQTTKDRETGQTKIAFNSVVMTAHGGEKNVKRAWDTLFKAGVTRSDYIAQDKYGMSYLDLNKLLAPNSKYRTEPDSTPQDLWQFLNDIGIVLDDDLGLKQALYDNPKTRKAGYFMWKRLKDLLEESKNLKDPYFVRDINTLFSYSYYPKGKGKSDKKNENGLYKLLAALQANYSDQYSSFAVSFGGKLINEESLNSTMSIIARDLSKVSSIKEMSEAGRFENLNNLAYAHNFQTPWLYTMRSLFNEDGSRRMVDGKPVTYQIDNMLGTVFTENTVQTGKTVTSSRADRHAKFLQDQHFGVNNVFENLRANEKATSTVSKLSNIYSGLNENDPGKFVTYKHMMNAVVTRETIYTAILPYLFGEFNRVHYFREYGTSDETLKHTPDYLKAGKMFTMFEDLLSDKAKAVLYREDEEKSIPMTATEKGQVFTGAEALKGRRSPLQDYLFSAEGKWLVNELKDSFYKYFRNGVFTHNIRSFNELLFMAPNVINEVRALNQKDKVANSLSDPGKVTNSELLGIILNTVALNRWMHYMEEFGIVVGDAAQYAVYDKNGFNANKSVKNVHKRLSTYASPGTIFRRDPSAISFINNVAGMPYAAANSIKSEFRRDMPTAIIDDPLETSVSIEHYEAMERAEIEDLFTSAWKKHPYLFKSNEEFKARVDKQLADTLKAYKDMEVGNAQCWVTFDHYRALSIANHDWDWDQQEKLFQLIAAKKPVPANVFRKFFPIRKYQYSGPLKTAGIAVNAIHKYAIYPLVPTEIAGTPLETLHFKMMKEGMVYATLKSGSKATTLVHEDGTMDKWGSSRPFQPNTIYLDYLKNQQTSHTTFEERVTISTQKRKILPAGMLDNGVPVDFMKTESDINVRKAMWDKLGGSKITSAEREKQKRNTSEVYRTVRRYEDAVKAKTEAEKQSLIKEIGWTESNYGTATQKLINLIKKELEKPQRSIGDQEIELIGLRDDLSNALLHDLSYFLSAPIIEKALVSLAGKRVFRQKTNGEPLVQVSSLGQLKPGEPELDNYEPIYEIDPATNKPKLYEVNIAGEIKYRKKMIGVKPAGAIIAMQGDYNALYEMKHKDGKKIKVLMKWTTPSGKEIDVIDENASLKRLNETIQDKEWLSKESNRKLITFTSTRIPVQGHNSMEVFQIRAFRPHSFGNKILANKDIVGKSGSDFDYDKLPSMFPSLRFNRKTGEVSLFHKYTRAEALREFNAFLLEGEDPGPYNKILETMFNLEPGSLDQEMVLKMIENGELSKDDFDNFFEKLNGMKSAENELIDSIISLILHPEIYTHLVRPNATFIAKPIADELEAAFKVSAENTKEYHPNDRVNSTEEGISWSQLVNPNYNDFVHMTNVGVVQALAISATHIPGEANFTREGFYFLTEYNDRGVIKPVWLPFKLPDGTNAFNTVTYKEGDQVKEGISIGRLYSAEGTERIFDITSQFTNGELEVGKDPWAFWMQANKEVVPIVHYLTEAGMPLRMAEYFVSQPLIQEYISELRQAKGPFAGAMGKAPERENAFVLAAKRKILTGISEVDAEGKTVINPNKYGFSFPSNLTDPDPIQKLYDLMIKLSAENPHIFTSEELYKRIEKGRTVYDDADRAAFLWFIEILEQAKAASSPKFALNYDTKNHPDIWSVTMREDKISDLENNTMYSHHLIDNMLGKSGEDSGSALAGLYSGVEFIRSFVKPVFLTRADERIGKFFISKYKKDGKVNFAELNTLQRLFGTIDKASIAFNNDLISYLFQNSLYGFDPAAMTEYKGFNIKNTSAGIKAKADVFVPTGAIVKNKTLYYDLNQMERDIVSRAYEKLPSGTKDNRPPYGGKANLARLENDTISNYNFREYYNFVFEREYLRTELPLSIVEGDIMWENMFKANMKKIPQGDLSDEAYNDKIVQITYEEYLRDRALENIGNKKALFNRGNSYAEQIFDFIIQHGEKHGEDLSKQYQVLNMIGISDSSDSENPVRNLTLKDTKLSSDDINRFHEDLKKLADYGVDKVPNPAENYRISSLFAKLPLVAFLQSGINPSTQFSLTRLVDPVNYSNVMRKATSTFLALSPKKMTVLLDNFYDQFKRINEDYARRTRTKDYATEQDPARFYHGRTKLKPEKGMSLPSEENLIIPVYETGLGHKVYDVKPQPIIDEKTGKISKDSNQQPILGTGITPAKAKYMTDKSVSTLYAYDKGSVFESDIITNNMRFIVSTMLERISYNADGTEKKVNYVKMTDATLPENMVAIDTAIAMMKEKQAKGYTFAFNMDGHGQYMIEGTKPGLKTFMYLSQRLLDSFNYVNKGYMYLDSEFRPDVNDRKTSLLKKARNIALQNYITNEAVTGYLNLPISATGQATMLPSKAAELIRTANQKDKEGNATKEAMRIFKQYYTPINNMDDFRRAAVMEKAYPKSVVTEVTIDDSSFELGSTADIINDAETLATGISTLKFYDKASKKSTIVSGTFANLLTAYEQDTLSEEDKITAEQIFNEYNLRGALNQDPSQTALFDIKLATDLMKPSEAIGIKRKATAEEIMELMSTCRKR